jgi:uncharacterized lipoprotein YmbA
MTQLRFILPYAITSLFLAGCGTLAPRPDPSKFFTLSSLPQSEADFNKSRRSAEMISLGIGPMKFPGYLDRQEIVFRSTQNRFDVSENDRWAEPLDENFARVLAQNLSLLLGSERITSYPWPSNGKPHYQVDIEVLNFEVNAAREAQLTARWTVIDGRAKTALNLKVTRVVRAAKEKSMDGSVAALSEAVGDLSREIADAVKTEEGKKQ